MATGRIGTTPVLTTRWSKAPSAGTTSLSGLDDNSVSLVYSVGYEAVYQNGVLLSRGNDYTATNGTTITLTTATVAGDIIEVFANQTIPLTDTYSQTVANSLFVNQATFDAKGDLIAGTADNAYSRLAVGTNGQVLTAASTTSTGLSWATPTAPAMVFITGASFSAVSSVSLPTNTFTSTYDIYKIFFQFSAASSTSVIQLRMRNSGTDVTSSNYFFGGLGTDYLSSTTVYKNGSANSAWTINADANIDRTTWELTFTNPQNSSFGGQGWITGMGDRMAAYSSGLWQNAVSTFDSMSIIKSTSGTISGKYAVYGLVKS
jgi:hypothetical protein